MAELGEKPKPGLRDVVSSAEQVVRAREQIDRLAGYLSVAAGLEERDLPPRIRAAYAREAFEGLIRIRELVVELALEIDRESRREASTREA